MRSQTNSTGDLLSDAVPGISVIGGEETKYEVYIHIVHVRTPYLGVDLELARRTMDSHGELSIQGSLSISTFSIHQPR